MSEIIRQPMMKPPRCHHAPPIPAFPDLQLPQDQRIVPDTQIVSSGMRAILGHAHQGPACTSVPASAAVLAPLARGRGADTASAWSAAQQAAVVGLQLRERQPACGCDRVRRLVRGVRHSSSRRVLESPRGHLPCNPLGQIIPAPLPAARGRVILQVTGLGRDIWRVLLDRRTSRWFGRSP